MSATTTVFGSSLGTLEIMLARVVNLMVELTSV